jgi:hypothetical protein
MFVLMALQVIPITAKIPEELGLGGRFCYWRGASGRIYIHSIYPAGACPPLPGAVHVAVRHRNGERRALAVGRFPTTWEAQRQVAAPSLAAADEIHVHLLARGDGEAEAVRRDLAEALASERPVMRNPPAPRPVQGELFAA